MGDGAGAVLDRNPTRSIKSRPPLPTRFRYRGPEVSLLLLMGGDDRDSCRKNKFGNGLANG